MSFLRKLFGREEEDVEVAPIKLDVEGRRQQLQRLEQALDALATEMRSEQSMDNPGWRARVNEYSRLAGDAADQRRAPTREGILDLVFEVRPVFTGEIPAGMEPLVPLQAEVLAAAEALREVLPGEKS